MDYDYVLEHARDEASYVEDRLEAKLDRSLKDIGARLGAMQETIDRVMRYLELVECAPSRSSALLPAASGGFQ